jgi:hypothetical protein
MAIEAAAAEPGQKVLVPAAGRGITAMDEKEGRRTLGADRRPVQGMDASMSSSMGSTRVMAVCAAAVSQARAGAQATPFPAARGAGAANPRSRWRSTRFSCPPGAAQNRRTGAQWRLFTADGNIECHSSRASSSASPPSRSCRTRCLPCACGPRTSSSRPVTPSRRKGADRSAGTARCRLAGGGGADRRAHPRP